MPHVAVKKLGFTMFTSLLHHAFGLPAGSEYRSIHFEKGEIIFVIREKQNIET
jgi:hypothetical protein